MPTYVVCSFVCLGCHESKSFYISLCLYCFQEGLKSRSRIYDDYVVTIDFEFSITAMVLQVATCMHASRCPTIATSSRRRGKRTITRTRASPFKGSRRRQTAVLHQDLPGPAVEAILPQYGRSSI